MNSSRKTSPSFDLLLSVMFLLIWLASGCSSPRAYQKVKPALAPPSPGLGRVFVCLQKGNVPYHMNIVVDDHPTRHAAPGEFLYLDLPLGEHKATFQRAETRALVCSQRFRLQPGQPAVIELLCSGGEQVVEDTAANSLPRVSTWHLLTAGESTPNISTTPLRWTSRLVPPENAEKVLARYSLEPGAWTCLDSAKFSNLPDETVENCPSAK